MKPKRIIVDLGCVTIFCILAASPAMAQTGAQFDKANQEYTAGHFKEAIANYEEIVSSGEYSANVFYDLGNAYFRERDFGNAILNYERALALDRHHPETEANLSIARDESRALELTPDLPERYFRFATASQCAIAAAIAFWFGLFCIARLIFARRRSGAVIALAVLSLAIFAAAMFAAYSIENGSKGRALAIVTGSEVEARLATADNANSVLALPPGSEIKILSKRGDWVYAALPNSLRGWIPAKSAESVSL